MCRDPPTILKPQGLSEDMSYKWKPRIGMVPATQVASLGLPGHRMLGLVSSFELLSANLNCISFFFFEFLNFE